ncbi:DMT family transporter [Ancylobacter dichloromethanicus]|uniref:Peptide ABC transporter ATP-binding protein n=1 Tax=Ancylobacter dichloromethanicus TaxID=518825 RepID=A0A9W6JCL0_9HYPH|nr:DMT family transporter [Ancylobacter dichloromethanicus]MBS7556707.1 DMT family transporter [Ancylobacter dichloromethanicus]GLK73559.1 peptide ABC transporter ATP-binding protein [Ancylobacter dichloromethanicus]
MSERAGVVPAAGTGKPLWLLAAPFLFLLLWSGGFAVAKVGILYTGPFTLLAWRYGFVLAVLLPLLAWFRPPLPRRPRAYVDLAVVGFFIQVLYFNLSYFAFRFGISAGALAIIVSMQPIVVGLVAPAFTGERVGMLRWIGLLLGLAGAALVITSRAAMEVTSPGVVLLGVGALMAMCAGALYEKRFGAPQHPLVSNTVQCAVGFACTLPLALLLEDGHVDWSLPLIAVLFYLVVGNSLIAISLYLAMIRAGEVAKVSALFFLVPPCSALIAWGLIGEAMPLVAWAGMALAAGGVALASLTRIPWRYRFRRRAPR